MAGFSRQGEHQRQGIALKNLNPTKSEVFDQSSDSLLTLSLSEINSEYLSLPCKKVFMKAASFSSVLAIAALCGLSSVAHAQSTVPDLTDLIGARGSSAETEVQSRGYQFTGNLGSSALWWNRRTKTCASITVDEGRVVSIMKSPSADCGKKDHPVAELSDLIGVRGSSAESELKSRGYQFSGNLGSSALWWNAGTKACMSVTVGDGRVVSIVKSPKRDCRQ
ncbi:hypothetical protein [Aphanothece stagnina]|uniref:hypothetical protein n=1 Tax=Aphanothece stagnina TaxID=1004305 RepID=UPI00398E6FAF